MCPYIEHEALTQEGFEVWDIIVRGGTQLRYSPKGTLLGFDYAPLLHIAQVLGYDSKVLLLLLTDAEKGLIEASQDHVHSNSEHFD